MKKALGLFLIFLSIQLKANASKNSNELISSFYHKRIQDWSKIINDAKSVRIELVQYFGKRERNLINSSLRSVKKNSIPKVIYKDNELLFTVNKKSFTLSLVSFTAQSFKINNKPFNLKDFASFAQLMSVFTTEFNVLMNVGVPGRFNLINSAYADEDFDASTIALSVIVFMVEFFHARTESCAENYAMMLAELDDYYSQCLNETRSFNKINQNSTIEYVNSWNSFLENFYLHSDNVCQDIGVFYDNENSQKCNFAQKLAKPKDKYCEGVVKINNCIQNLLTKVQG
jgi:hypothetical protein